MTRKRAALASLAALTSAALIPATALGAELDHVHVAVPSTIEAVGWYTEHLPCATIDARPDAIACGAIELEFVVQATSGSTQGTGINHIAFSFADVTAKMAELENVGVRGTGVRLQRFADGATLRDEPGLFLHGFIFDPWGTRIELLEDAELLGFHHVHLSASDPAETLDWYADVIGGERARLKEQLDGLKLDNAWLLASEHGDGTPAQTAGRAVDHLGFVVPDIETTASDMRDRGVTLEGSPELPANARAAARRAFVLTPDNVRLAVVEAGWAGVDTEAATVARESREPYTPPMTPWGEPDLQGIWTGDAAHGIPLERPEDVEEAETLTAAEAAARRERGTLNSIWGYEREWRDTSLGYTRMAPSRQVAMIVDPPNGRLPPMTPEGEALALAGASAQPGRPAGPEDLNTWVRCITRGLPGLMLPRVYNNGLQIVQSPGYVAVQKEMIHETRVIPTEAREHLGAPIRQWLGDPRGRWEGNTLVVDVTNFNGNVSYLGSSENMKLTERYTRIGPDALEYEFTVDDPTVWTRPWTARFTFVKDDAQYEIVEYACHEGNYGLENILSGARAEEQAEIEAAAQ